MKKVILDKSLYADVLYVNTDYDSFCTVLNCSLIKLHENAELYVCVRTADKGKPCKLYIANSHETIAQYRGASTETEWLEVTGTAKNEAVRLYHRNASGNIEKNQVAVGIQKPMIPKSLCHTMDRLSDEHNEVSVICHKKTYTEAEKKAFQKRSVMDLSLIDSSGVDIIYFDGANKLIEKLLYGGCRELTVFITDTSKTKGITKALDRISRKAPFSNRITIVIGGTYAPRTATTVLVGNAAAMLVRNSAQIFFSVDYTEGEGVGVSVGQNTAEFVSNPIDHRLKPHTLHYITSIMSELVLHAVSAREYHAKRLFRINAKTLATETTIKEG